MAIGGARCRCCVGSKTQARHSSRGIPAIETPPGFVVVATRRTIGTVTIRHSRRARRVATNHTFAIVGLVQLLRAPASIQALMRARFAAESFGFPGGMEPLLTVI